jgi:hypothetical protein
MTPEEKVQVLLAHPDESPEILDTLPYLIHPPSRLSSTARWREFRDKTLLPLIDARPDDPNLPRFLEQTETVLAWRTTACTTTPAPQTTWSGSNAHGTSELTSI